jgi:Fe2+ transport protein
MDPERTGPPMDPDTDEASPAQLDAARAQGQAYGRAVGLMTMVVADDGRQQRAGDYIVGYAVEKAEGMYEWVEGGLEWRAPERENLHLEITVRDAGDGRFVPALRVLATLVDPDGDEVGTHEQPMLWHPMLYHYGRNWELPCDGDYTLRVQVDPPRFPRHDEVNGRRFMEPVDVEFTGVHVERGRE